MANKRCITERLVVKKVAIHEEKGCKVNRHFSFLTKKGKNIDLNFKPSLYLVINYDFMLGVDRLDWARQSSCKTASEKQFV
jgi:hypothetical protein